MERPYRKTGSNKICKCGVSFYCPKWASNRKKYCSKQCFFKYKPVGHPMSAEARKKLSIAHLGMKHTLVTRQKISNHQKGKKLSLEHREKIGLKGEKNPAWRGGITPINKRIRNSFKYRAWREAVFERDNYTCQDCGIHGVYLQADHIKQFAYYPELRFELSNGRTLCVPCHELTPTYKSKSKIYVAR